MQISAKDLSHSLNGTIEGNPDVMVSQPSKIEEATADSICFFAISISVISVNTAAIWFFWGENACTS